MVLDEVTCRFGLYNGSNGHGGGFSSGVLLAFLLVFFWVLLAFLLVFFWCSSGVLLVFDNTEERQKNARRTPEERQKNTRRTQKNPEEPRRRRTPAPPRLYKLFVLFAWGVGTCVTWPMTWPVLFWRAPSPRGPGDDMRYEAIPNERRRRPHRDMLLHRAFSASTIKPQQTSVPHCSS